MKVHLLAVLLWGEGEAIIEHRESWGFFSLSILYIEIYFTIALKYSNHNEGF